MLQILSPTAQFYRVMKNKIRRSPRTAEESKVQENHARSFFVQHSSKGYLAPSTLPNLRAICKTCETSHLQNIRSTSHLQKRMRNRSQFFLETVQPSETRLQWQPLSKKTWHTQECTPKKKALDNVQKFQKPLTVRKPDLSGIPDFFPRVKPTITPKPPSSPLPAYQEFPWRDVLQGRT